MERDTEHFRRLGGAVSRLRRAQQFSLGQLSAQSGVSKSIISAIERNETNPTLSTLLRLSEALGCTIEEILGRDDEAPILEHLDAAQVPLVTSEDGLCQLQIIGWLQAVEWVQWYRFSGKAGGILSSVPHPKGSVENLSVLQGSVAVTVADERRTLHAGDTLRYRGDLPHQIEVISEAPAEAIMVNLLRRAVGEPR